MILVLLEVSADNTCFFFQGFLCFHGRILHVFLDLLCLFGVHTLELVYTRCDPGPFFRIFEPIVRAGAYTCRVGRS